LVSLPHSQERSDEESGLGSGPTQVAETGATGVNSWWDEALAGKNRLVYAQFMLEEKDFRRKADEAFDDLKKRLLALGDEHGFDVEGESGKLEVIFEEPEAKFVISPNTPVREIWISALSTSFKLGWNEARNAFVQEKTGEDLYTIMSRVVSQQLGEEVKV